jgi:protein SCO1/2
MSVKPVDSGTRWSTLRFPLFALLLAVVAVPAAAWWHAFAASASAAPDFSLGDGTAQPFVLSAQRGHPVLLFFGYTHCADACPTTLAHIAAALRTPGVPQDERVAFITVDPARDSAALLARYVRLFDPRFIGLAGPPAELDRVYGAYHVVRQDQRDEPHSKDYSVLHTTTIYYVDRHGSLSGFGSGDDTVATIAADLKRFQ